MTWLLWCWMMAGGVSLWGMDAAAVTLSDGKEGTTFFLFGTGAVGAAEALPEALAAGKYSAVDVSSWARRADHEAILRRLKEAGFKVERFYAYAPGAPDWARRNLVAAMPELPPSRPLQWVELPISGDAYNLRYKLPGKFPRGVRYVTIHNTAEPFSARQERDRVEFRRDRMSVSFHFAVDEKEAVRILPLDIHGWHAGDGGKGPGNTESIGIEICRSQCRDAADDWYRRSEANAALLAAALLRHYGLTAAELRMHRDWSGKFCPHRILEEQRWPAFRQAVAERLAADPAPEERTLLAELAKAPQP